MNTTAETYPTIEAAIAELQMLCGMFFRGDQRSELRALIAEKHLSRQYVADLANEINAETLSRAPEQSELSHSGVFSPATGAVLLPVAG